MRRISWLVCLAVSAVFWGVDRAHASPLKLEIGGSADGVSLFYQTIDVTDGFSEFVATGGYRIRHNWENEDWRKPIESSISVFATLYDANRNLGEVVFSAPVTGTLYYSGAHARFDTDAHGSAIGEFRISSGVDPSLIPSWFTGLTATVTSSVGMADTDLYNSTLTISAAPVPEPSSVLVFLAAAGFLGFRRLRRG